ncbi:MAG: hypothetical protein ACOC8B_05175, partial [Gemmatimonadota bacterium]
MGALALPRRPGPSLVVPGRYARPMVPSAVAHAVEGWAETWGRRVRWEWVDHPGLRCWAVHLSPVPGDPKRKAVQEGDFAPGEADEHILLVDGGEAMDLEQYGPSGVVRWLERNNMYSGRGEVDGLEAQVRRERDRKRERAEQRKSGLR